MNNWFEVKARYDKMLDSGQVKTVTESYLIEAVSFTEAETRAVEELTPYMSGEFSISAVGKKKFSETFFNDTGDIYYRCKLQFITLDEKSGSEKKTSVNMLVQASTLKEAVEIIDTEMEKSMVDYAIHTVAETPIIDVYPYSESDKN